jgi:hypothetical protein
VTVPAIIPAGWQVVDFGFGPHLMKQHGALRALFTIDELRDGLYGIAGAWRHMSISRRLHYPTWEEMRDFIRASGLFDLNDDVVMILPPVKEHVNVHEFCMHWWQPIRST